jgi:hypothetical protein
MTQKKITNRQISRRHVLTTLGSGATFGLGGCLGGIFGSSSTEITKTPTVITKTSFTPYTLEVTLREQASVGAVNFISPNGTSVSSVPVAAGQTTVTLPLVTQERRPSPLSPGTYTLIAANDGDTIAQQDVQLTASWDLADMQIGKKARTTVITLENTGHLPVKLTYLGLVKGVPSPSPPPNKFFTTITPANLRKKQYQQFIGVGSHAAFLLLSDEFRFDPAPGKTPPRWQRNAAKCRGLTHEATLMVKAIPTGTRTYSLPITYGGKPTDVSGVMSWCTKMSVGNASRTGTTNQSV